MRPLAPRSWLLLLLLLLVSAPAARADDLPPQAAEIRDLLRVQKLDEAIARAEAWTAASPESALAWSWAGRAYAQQAIKSSIFTKPAWASKVRVAFERSVELDGANVDARFDLLTFYLQAPGLMGGSAEKAGEQAEAIARVDPAGGHIARGAIALHDEDLETAEREYRAAVAAAPDEPRARVSLAGLLSSQKRWREARAVFNEALARKPDDARTLYQLGKLSALSGEDLEDGLRCLDRYLAQKERPDELPEFGAHWRRAQVLEHLGRKDEAIAELRVATGLDPSAEGPKKDLKRLGGG